MSRRGEDVCDDALRVLGRNSRVGEGEQQLEDDVWVREGSGRNRRGWMRRGQRTMGGIVC
eukprot:749145-Hanusia_phi.AAC.2